MDEHNTMCNNWGQSLERQTLNRVVDSKFKYLNLNLNKTWKLFDKNQMVFKVF